MPSYIVNVIAADQVGIIHAVTGAVREHGGNVLELSQTVMRGYFTIILEAAFAQALDRDRLAAELSEKGRRFGMTVDVVEASPDRRPPVVDGERFILTVLGTDSPGIIHGITGCLAEHGVNIVDLHARSEADRFTLVMEAYLPSDLPPTTVRDELERFGRGLGLEAFVQHETIFTATSEPSPVRVGAGRGRSGPSTLTTEGSAAVVPH
jgi:glycine cleavage system transcriptional repressor